MSLAPVGPSRYRLIWVLGVTALSVNTLTRAVLLLAAGSDAELNARNLLGVLGTGWIYDTAFYAYAAIPLVLWLWLLPSRAWSTRAIRALTQAALLLCLYGMGFTLVAEWIFWREFHARFNFIAVDYLIYTREVVDNVFESYPVGPLLCALAIATMILYWRLCLPLVRAYQMQEGFPRRTAIAVLLLAVPTFFAFTLGQGPRDRFANQLQSELASNGPYQFFAAFRNNELDYERFYPTVSRTEADRLLRAALAEPRARFLSKQPFHLERAITNPEPEQRLNVILITVESLSAEFLTRFGNTRGLTPFLDGLVDESLFFDRFYATGTRTVRGLEAVTLSIPPTPGRSIVKRIGRESGLWSLGNVLREKGYSVRFLYGGRGYFDNMNAFFAGNGYQITDQSSVPDHEISFANAWGMSDEDLYRQVLKQADTAHKRGSPFFLHIMTTSNHRPYTYPEGKIDLPSGSGRDGAVKYTDYALRQFIGDARRRPWFDDTVFVILADHTANAAGKRALPVTRYHIPLWIYSPRHVQPAIIHRLASQIDVAPTLLGLLNMQYRSKAFGKDLLNASPGDGRALIANYQHLGLLRADALVDLSPVKHAQVMQVENGQIVGPEHSTTVDRRVKEGIALYQGASYIYRHHLDNWTPPQFASNSAGTSRLP